MECGGEAFYASLHHRLSSRRASGAQEFASGITRRRPPQLRAAYEEIKLAFSSRAVRSHLRSPFARASR